MKTIPHGVDPSRRVHLRSTRPVEHALNADVEAGIVMAALDAQSRIATLQPTGRLIEHDIDEAVKRHRRELRVECVRIDIEGD
jgi:hypothetical protein